MPEKTENLIDIEEIPGIANAMLHNVQKLGYKTLFFPKAGAWPLKFCCQNIFEKMDFDNFEVFSSKITAFSKAPIPNQICGILTQNERKSHLRFEQKKLLQVEMGILANKFPLQINVEGINKILDSTIEAIIHSIAGVGLYVPSEDPALDNSQSFTGTDINDLQILNKFKKESVKKIVNQLDSIKHDSRKALNIVLSDTHFSRALVRSGVYVFDEAISRGRLLNSLEVVFKSFKNDAEWNIGVVYCPLKETSGKINYIFSDVKFPPLSNRCDLIGEIVVETETSFKTLKLEEIIASHVIDNPEQSELVIEKFEKCLTDFVNDFFSTVDKNIQARDIERAILYFLLVDNKDTIIRCIDLRPIDCAYLIAQTDFYINMPHPFAPIEYRNNYKNAVLNLMDRFYQLGGHQQFEVQKIFVKEQYKNISRIYEYNLLKLWSNRHLSIKSRMMKALANI